MSVVRVLPVTLPDGVGYIVVRSESLKIESQWVYDGPEEAQGIADRLNDAAKLARWRPDAHDPEVQDLLNDPEFQPVQYEDVEVLDEENSDLAYVTPQIVDQAQYERYLAHNIIDKEGRALGTDGKPVVNWQASTVVTKVEQHPKRVQGFGRIDAAIVKVARERMERDKSGNVYT